ncbi:ABC-2 type transport system permease protein [Crossiella equi]|uniref:ABC-2 type transport system permease protein n=1 Tax=Crossiella equi TaxID=130796 RepID=A0ABS5ACW2_9PSEU|nr:hypothetical protein [Crossiella equi]MBP2474132.1 ABC-2 type transport system permease protein [Crossiella equi]
MVGVLIRMKLRLLRHGLRGGARAATLVGGALGGLVVAGLTVLLSTVDLLGAPMSGYDLAAALFTGWTFGWVLGPVLVAGSDETLQPEHFRLLPIGPRTLAGGLLVAALVGVPPVVSLLAFGGLVVRGAADGPGVAVVAGVGAVVQLAFVVTLSRVVVGALGDVLRSRRGQDLGVLLAAGAGLLVLPLQYVVNTVQAGVFQGFPPGLGELLRLLPSGWAPGAALAASHGQWGVAVLRLACLAVLTVLLALVWSILLRRRMTRPAAGLRGPRARTGRGLLARLLPAGPVGAVAGKEVLLWWRDPRRRAVLLPGMLIGLVVPLVVGGANPAATWLAPLGGLAVAGFAALNAGNLYGFDGSSVWHLLVQPDAVRADVRGRQLGWLVLVAPVAGLAALVLPAATGLPEAYPHVLALLPAVLGGGAGLVVVLSAFAPFPLPAQRGNPFGGTGNPGCAKVLLQLGIGLLLFVAALPPGLLLLAGYVNGSVALTWLAVPAGIGSGALCAWWWGLLAIRRVADRGPELLLSVRA